MTLNLKKGGENKMKAKVRNLLIDRNTLQKDNKKLKAEIKDNKNEIKKIDKELKNLAFKK